MLSTVSIQFLFYFTSYKLYWHYVCVSIIGGHLNSRSDVNKRKWKVSDGVPSVIGTEELCVEGFLQGFPKNLLTRQLLLRLLTWNPMSNTAVHPARIACDSKCTWASQQLLLCVEARNNKCSSVMLSLSKNKTCRNSIHFIIHHQQFTEMGKTAVQNNCTVNMCMGYTQ